MAQIFHLFCLATCLRFQGIRAGAVAGRADATVLRDAVKLTRVTGSIFVTTTREACLITYTRVLGFPDFTVFLTRGHTARGGGNGLPHGLFR